jgi:putative transposase
MSQYRRWFVPGGTYFFTANLIRRDSRLLVENINALRAAYADAAKRQPFTTVAICVLPNHLHCIWTLPEGDSDFPGRWRRIKSGFSRRLPRSADLAPGRRPGRTRRVAAPLLGARHHRC